MLFTILLVIDAFVVFTGLTIYIILRHNKIKIKKETDDPNLDPDNTYIDLKKLTNKQPKQQPEKQLTPTTKTCSYCGASIKVKSKKCSNCGAKLS